MPDEKPVKKDAKPVIFPAAAYSPKQFCQIANISLSLLWKAWREGNGPKFGRLGARIIITHQDGMEWLQKLAAQDERAA
jgi:hypothetical protein